MAALAESSSGAIERALYRERKARKRAEELLESKSRELFELNNELTIHNASLERRTTELGVLHTLAVQSQEKLKPRLLFMGFVESICSVTGWPVGHVFVPDPNGVTEWVSGKVWYLEDPDIFAEFRELTQASRFQVGQGLPGQVVAKKCSVWLDDLSLGNVFERTRKAIELDVAAGFAVPIESNGDIVAVAEFFFSELTPDSKHYLTLAETAALQLGTALARVQQEELLRENYEELHRIHSELSDAQAQLMQSEKLASLGQMAAGVAHEINNPVGFVTSNFSSLAEYMGVVKQLVEECRNLLHGDSDNRAAVLDAIRSLDQEEDLDFIVEDIDHLLKESASGLHRVKDIVHGLKSFARVDSVEVQEADINECLETTLKMAWNEIKYKCEVEKDLAELPLVRCHPGQLNQVFLNLMVNASQAIEETGIIRIQTRAADDGENVYISIADNGPGIDPQNISKLFTPFFTTKPVGEGTGLGLSISYGIVTKHGGSLDVDSTLGEGTTFNITLPINGV